VSGPGGKRIRVLVVEDHFVARFGLKGLIDDQPDMTVVAEAATGPQAVKLHAQHRPDVVLMDLRLPELDGIGATAAICRDDQAAKVLMFSTYDREEEVARALEAGAKGYILKEADGRELLSAIRVVFEGGRYLRPGLAQRLAENAQRERLNAREMQILHLMWKGLSNREIADELKLTHGTVRIYVSHVFEKLGVGKRTEAVAVALERGLIRDS
jgi:two-component system NarL family response regulator